jgi:hypothetical protein
MTQSTRKLVGTLLTLVVLIAWAGMATAIYVTWLTGLPSPVLLAYFAIAGLGWALPVARIIRWMARPDRV